MVSCPSPETHVSLWPSSDRTVFLLLLYTARVLEKTAVKDAKCHLYIAEYYIGIFVSLISLLFVAYSSYLFYVRCCEEQISKVR